MEFVMELLMELILDVSVEAGKSSKVPKPVRYLLAFMISLFILAVICLIIFAGILCLNNSVIAGIFLILVGLFMLIMCIMKFIKTVEIKRQEENL